MVYVDAGNDLVPSARMNHGDLGEAERIKAALILETAKADAVDALVFGEEDWRLGRAWLTEHSAGLPVLAANLTCDGAQPWPGSTVVERGGLRFGIVGVTAGEVDGCEVTDPVVAVQQATAALEADFVIALLPYRLAKLGEGEAIGANLVVTGGEPVRYEALQPWRGGYKAGAGGQTKYIGTTELVKVEAGQGWVVDPVLEIQAEIDKTEALRERIQKRLDAADKEADQTRYRGMVERYELTLAKEREKLDALANSEGPKRNLLRNRIDPLDEHLADHGETLARVTAAKEAVTAAATGGQDVDALAAVPRLIPGDSPWAGSDQCSGCHSDQHMQWSRTPHSRAYAGLVKAQRAMDPECFSCHVTGAHKDGGPSEASLVGPFRDVQCESCHGPAGAHVRDPAGHKPVKTPSEATCTECHDGERDMGRFEFERYLKRVEH
ncbi:MAG: hypothetical protein EP330_29665 [Deltaproteobacteria bacterium]|nr:MAG: hypothetical protein EP330_29665 [Deltaproteobacteria bacterium]